MILHPTSVEKQAARMNSQGLALHDGLLKPSSSTVNLDQDAGRV